MLLARTLHDAVTRSQLSWRRWDTRWIQRYLSGGNLIGIIDFRCCRISVESLLEIRQAQRVENTRGEDLEGHVERGVADKRALLGLHALIQALHHGTKPVLIRHVSHAALRGHHALLEYVVGILVSGLLLGGFVGFRGFQNLADAVFELSHNFRSFVRWLRIAPSTAMSRTLCRPGYEVRHRLADNCVGCTMKGNSKK